MLVVRKSGQMAGSVEIQSLVELKHCQIPSLPPLKVVLSQPPRHHRKKVRRRAHWSCLGLQGQSVAWRQHWASSPSEEVAGDDPEHWASQLASEQEIGRRSGSASQVLYLR